MSYQAFLERKRRVDTGISGGADSVLPGRLYDWQAAIVRWALRKGRAAIFADCGLMVSCIYDRSQKQSKTKLRRVWHCLRETRVPIRQGARSVLLESVPGLVEAARISTLLRVVRLAVLSEIWRARSWGARAAVLLGRMLHRVARFEADELSKGWRTTQASYCGRGGARAAVDARGSCPPHRRGQAEFSPVESLCFSFAVGACALPLRGDVR